MAAPMNERSEQRHLAGLLLLLAVGGASVLSLGGLMRAMFLPSDVAAAVRQEMLASNSGLAAPEMFGTGQMLNGGAGRQPASNYQPLDQQGEATNEAGGPTGILPSAVNPDATGESGGNTQEFALGSPSGFDPAGTGAGSAGSSDGTSSGGGLPGGDLGIDPNLGGGSSGGSVTPTEPLPEPETWAMMTVGLAVAGWMARRKRRQAAA